MIMIGAYSRIDREKGLQCTLTKEFMLSEILSKPCFYCEDADSPIGCDRIDNRLGHTPENVVPCCALCNRARGDRFTHAEMVELGKTMRMIKLRRRALESCRPSR